MSVFKLSNSIFNVNLTASEMAVYAYFCSLPSDCPQTFDDSSIVKVKQATIASKCGIKSVQTVAKAIASLAEKSLIEPVRRSIKPNGYKSTYIYNVKKLPTNDSFFFVDRTIFGQLVPRQLMVYLFICKSFSTQLCDCWNSYADISKQTGMKRETVIQTVAELEALKLIRKSKRKSKANKRVFVDNHYVLIFYVSRRMLKSKKMVRSRSKSNRTNNSIDKLFNIQVYNNIKKAICQDLNEKTFSNRGSPQIESH